MYLIGGLSKGLCEIIEKIKSFTYLLKFFPIYLLISKKF